MENLRLDRRPEARAFSVEALLQLVRDGKIRIPEFQRPLRWRASHVIDLLDSVYRGFPVGDLLLYRRAAEAGVVHVGPVDVHAPAVSDAYFVVDGQQRIAALAGAMLHPEPRPHGDNYAVWFDLEEERFVRGWRPPPHWIPLNVVGDSFALLTWLNAWPFRSQRPDLVQRAIALGKALREYHIPAYVVEGASEDAIRLIFKRVNTSGVAMEESEVFGALFHGGEAQPVESACARLQTATGFGTIHGDWFMRCFKVVEGLPLARALTERQMLDLDPRAIEATENALLRAFRFLADDAGLMHINLMPYLPLPLAVLARFFHLHPRPAERTRVLLSRWLWRGALSHMHIPISDDALQQASGLVSGDECAQALERLLGSLKVVFCRVPSVSAKWAPPETAHEQLPALALAHLSPRNPETGEVLGRDEIRALLQRYSLGDVFIDVEGLIESTVVRRVLVSSYDKIEKLPSASLAVLESHGLDQEAADALGRGDIATFIARRGPILDRWFQRFFTARIGADDGDRPPIAELMRRVDKALDAGMSALDVHLGSTRVGLLERLDEWQYRFSFDASWLADPAHPVLGQIFEDRMPRDLESTGTLPPWFDHLLPPQGGPLRRAISRQSGIEGDDDFALLELLGADLPGAVILSPGTPSLAPRSFVPAAPKPPVEGALRFSLAGMQWKLSVREQDRKLTLPLRGETGGAIAKFPSPTYRDLPRVELATMTWAKLSGIDVPPIRLARASDIANLPEGIPIGDGTIYLIDRFDRRPDGGRVHIEDFGQVLDRPADDHIYEARYEHIAAFLAYLPPEDLRAFCERLVFCVLCGNTDAHVKNWSLIYPDGRHPRLSPAYDLVATILYEPFATQGLALTLDSSRRFQDVSVASFRPLAEVTRQSFDDVSTWVREMVERVLAAWHEGRAELPYLAEERALIEAHLERVPLSASG